ncbi:MAG: Gfo/Idh/MocA family protein [Spirosomataceae bacterium]
MNRQEFLRTSALAGAAVLARPFITFAHQSKYRVALIGSGWWGTNILREAIRSGETQVVALCDVDESQLKKCQEEVNKLCNDQPKLYKDYRELLQKEKPEIVINATPDHWHALIAIDAMNAGAHVYLEKPISHTLNEGKAIVAAARRNNRVCIVGFHRRYSPHNVSGRDFIRSGKVGQIGMIRTFVHYGGGSGQMTPAKDIPQGFDWDAYCGPAPMVPYHQSIHPRGFRQHMNFANGQIGDWGVHWFDQILWCMEEKAPKKIYSTGGRAIKKDNTDAPDHQIAVYDFENFKVEWEHRLFASNEAEKSNVGVYFYGTEGTFHMGWLDGWTFYPADKKKQIIHEDAKLNAPDQQNIDLVWADLLRCIKSGDRPTADIEFGHRSTSMSLLGNLSMKHGKSIEWDANKEIIINDSAANKLLSRDYRKGYSYPKG